MWEGLCYYCSLPQLESLTIQIISHCSIVNRQEDSGNIMELAHFEDVGEGFRFFICFGVHFHSIFKTYCFEFSILTLWYRVVSIKMFSLLNHTISFISASKFGHIWLWAVVYGGGMKEKTLTHGGGMKEKTLTHIYKNIISFCLLQKVRN